MSDWEAIAKRIAREMRIRKKIADKRHHGLIDAAWFSIFADDLETGKTARPRINDDGTIPLQEAQ